VPKESKVRTTQPREPGGHSANPLGRLRGRNPGEANRGADRVNPFEPDSSPAPFQIQKIFCTFVNIHKKLQTPKFFIAITFFLWRYGPPKFAASRPTSKLFCF
jgi:hypothetical protein